MSFIGSLANCEELQYPFLVISLRAKRDFQGRNSTIFLTQARGSLAELETQVLITRDLDYISQEERACWGGGGRDGQMLNRLIASIKIAA